jgi:hypothetical protein
MNIKEYKVPKILFIKSVFIKDCIPIDDLFEQQIIDQLLIETPIITYVPLPSTFFSLDTWIQKTNIKCWYCDLNFDNMPIFIPTNIDKIDDSNKYHISTHGCFCSFGCSISYNNIHNQNICDRINNKEMIFYLYNIFYTNLVRDIMPSPNKYIMKQYGGVVDSMVYRHMINENKSKIITHNFN